jgi:hypothetical protein
MAEGVMDNWVGWELGSWLGWATSTPPPVPVGVTMFPTPRRRPTQDIIIDDDDEILLAWFMFLRMPYE